MIICGGGVGHQNHRQAECGQFCQAGGTTAGDGHIRSGVGHAHVLTKGHDGSLHRRGRIGGFQFLKFARAGDVKHLNAMSREERQGLQHGTVHPARALAAAHYEDSLRSLRKAEKLQSLPPVWFCQQGRAQWGAGHSDGY